MFPSRLLLLLAAPLLVSQALAKPKEFTAIRIDLEGSTGLCPGQSQRLDLFGTDAKGKEFPVRAASWKQLSLSWDIGEVSPKGALEMPDDVTASWGKAGKVDVSLANDPTVKAEALLPARYDCKVVAQRGAPAGQAGQRGASGGSSAASAGGDGGDGGDGYDGPDGPEVEVSVRLVSAQGVDVLQVAMKNLATGETSLHAVAVSGGRLTIDASGGAGGPGGTGGSGGNGTTGLDGGDGGQGGQGGKGGKGGRITVMVDPSAQGKLDALVFDNRGGGPGSAGLKGDAGQGFSPGKYGQPGHPGSSGQRGADGPAVVLKVEAVPPLW
ncbi:MAG: collagen-like protein [Myxococcota bacterium]